jgi:glycyl-tRNA synthetase beta chain
MSDLFIEIRCEELPARFVATAEAGLRDAVLSLLKGLELGAVRTWSTPRRVAVEVLGVPTHRPAVETLVTGPPAAAAYKDGAPTGTAIGFARGKGIAVEALEIVDGPKGPVIAARVQSGGEPVAVALAEGLERLLLATSFPKTMRWGANSYRWARPVHSVVVLHGGQLVDLSFAGIRSGRETLGHRMSPAPLEVGRGAPDWLEGLRKRHVEPDRLVRRQRILNDLGTAAKALGAELLDADKLIEEVCDLVEWPVVISASFGATLLDLPPRLLVEAMRVHQRVFPLAVGGHLSHHFLVVTNQPMAAQDPEAQQLIARGNTKVLSARFHDARFFYAEDKKKRLEQHAAKLQTMRWVRGGGTMADKVARLADLAGTLAPRLGADPALAMRAAALSKADLCTQMVGEFPELQGHVGHLLALFEGEGAAVAGAIEDHYLPRFAGDVLPSGPVGRAVALADRLDTLFHCFRLGMKPKGGADPLGLRRAANGLLAVVADAGLRGPLATLLVASGPEIPADLEDFILTRFKATLGERHPTDLVDAVLASGDTDVVALSARADALAALAATSAFGPLKTTFKRVAGLTRDHSSTAYDAAELRHPAEAALHGALQARLQSARAHGVRCDYRAALDELSALKAPVDALFDAVMVMDPDLMVRQNRLGLLRTIADAFGDIADFTHLSAEEASP